MFKSATIILFALIAGAAAKAGLIDIPLAYNAPATTFVAASAPAVTATSSQYIARNHNGIVSTPVAAPFVAPAAYAVPVAYTHPLHHAAAAIPGSVFL